MDDELRSHSGKHSSPPRRIGTWRTFDVTDGIPGGARCVAQDRYGYLWIGTRGGGICRFDGKESRVYTVADGLPAHTIEGICLGQDGLLWFTTNAGLVCFDGDRFRTYTTADGLICDKLRGITGDTDGNLWIGSQGGGVACFDGNAFKTYTTDDGLLTNNAASVCIDAQGRAWIGSSCALTCLENGKPVHYTREDGLIITETGIGNLLADRQGRIWCATECGLCCFENGHFIPYTRQHGLAGNRIGPLAEDRAGRIWIGTWGSGLSCLENGRFTAFTSEDGLLSNGISHIMQDYEGLLWFVNNLVGLTCLDLATFEIVAPQSQGFIHGSPERLWYANASRLHHISKGRVRHRDMPNKVNAMLQDAHGAFWLGIENNGVWRCESAEHLWIAAPRRFGTEDGLPCDRVLAVFQKKDGAIYVGCEHPGHICRFNGERFEGIPTGRNLTDKIYEDAQGRLWLGGWAADGLTCYDGESVTTYTEKDGLINNAVRSIVSDREGRIWVGTIQGLCSFDGRTFTHYGEEYGIPNVTHECSAIDQNGQLWFGTVGGGIIRYDGQHFQMLTAEEGLPGNGIVGLLPQPDGSMLIGTFAGAVRYHQTAVLPPHVEIREVVADRVYPYPKAVEMASTGTDLVTITFDAVTFTTRHVRFTYQLEGYDEIWHDTWHNQVRYQNLPPGSYTFRVAALNRDLIHAAQPVALSVTVKPDPRAHLLEAYRAQIGRMETTIEQRQRADKLNRVLIELARETMREGIDLNQSLTRLTEAAAETLEVARAGVWMLREDQTAVRCADMFERSTGTHLEDVELNMTDYATYLALLEENRIVAVADVTTGIDREHKPLLQATSRDVTAFMEAPIRLYGDVIGAFRIEHTQGSRSWTADEQHFAVSIADFVVLLIEIYERTKTESARRELEEKIQDSQKLESLGILAGGIAHDFNNLLMGMLGYAGLALMKLPPESPARESINQIETAALRAAELAKQMLVYSGRSKALRQSVDLSRLVQEMAHLLDVAISKKVALRYNFAENLPPVTIDPTQIRQVVMNLITNASDAVGDANGVISVSTGSVFADRDYLGGAYLDEKMPEGRYVYLEVSDTGCGMDEETKQRIFDPFYTTKADGRGLGLSAILGIIRKHNGAIKVYSEKGRGTTFKILLPANGGSARDTRGESSAHEELYRWRGSGKVLVVDDEPTVRTYATDTLRSFGFEVVTAEDGDRALDLFREAPDDYTLILMDLAMPTMDGLETFGELRRIRKDVKVIISSGYNEHNATDRFAGRGIAGFIQKPYRPIELAKVIREIVET